MPDRRRNAAARWLRGSCLGLLLLPVSLAGPFSRADDDVGVARKYSTAERMRRSRLAATHEDARRYQQARRSPPAIDGLLDVRAVLHAHAEDSTHTGGTRVEMAADARRAGVQVILLTNHHRPPHDFIDDNWRGWHDGVLFIPGAEARGFLLFPTASVMAHMQAPLGELASRVRQDRGLMFLSHLEERLDHPVDQCDGLEIYNRHADAKRDLLGIAELVLRLTDADGLRQLEEALRQYPEEVYAAQCSYLADYLAKWDRETQTRRLTGIAANDAHHNQILLVKMVDENTVQIGTNVDPPEKFRSVSGWLRPGVRELTRGRKPGDVLARLDFDPYYRSFRNVSTHLLATEVSEAAIRLALREGRAYVAHDWMCDPTGFSFELVEPRAGDSAGSADGSADGSAKGGAGTRTIMGAERPFAAGQRLVAAFPVACRMRLLSNGKVVADQAGDRLEFTPPGPGVYRVEGWLTLDGEDRPWIYSNPLYLREE